MYEVRRFLPTHALGRPGLQAFEVGARSPVAGASFTFLHTLSKAHVLPNTEALRVLLWEFQDRYLQR